MQQRFAEFQESVGNKLIPILLGLFNMIDTKIVPAFNFLKEKAIDPVLDAINRNKDAFKAFGDLIGTYVVPILTGAFAGALIVVGKVASGVIDIIGKVASGITTLVNGAIGLINNLISAYNKVPLLPNVPLIPKVSTPTISVPKISVPSVSGITGGGGVTGGSSTGSSGISGAAKTIAATATSTPGLTALELANIPRTGSAAGTAGASILTANPNVNIYVQGPSIIDEAGFTNSVIQAFNNGTYRGTAGAGMLAGL